MIVSVKLNLGNYESLGIISNECETFEECVAEILDSLAKLNTDQKERMIGVFVKE